MTPKDYYDSREADRLTNAMALLFCIGIAGIIIFIIWLFR